MISSRSLGSGFGFAAWRLDGGFFPLGLLAGVGIGLVGVSIWVVLAMIFQGLLCPHVYIYTNFVLACGFNLPYYGLLSMTLAEWSSKPTPAPSNPNSAAPVPVVMERRPAAEDSDTATAQTIRMMCDYIRKCASDPVIEGLAARSWKVWGTASNDPSMRAWGVFWLVKHAVKFRHDEATMFRIGEPNQQDLLTAPDVLVRMDDPAEDCDGFTMLVCSLLSCLGVGWVIATVAADPKEPGRWSHVFPIALLPSGPLPLDASHGPGPGWMVPQERIFRWQCWDLDAKPVNMPMPQRPMGNYIRRGRRGRGFGGLGDTCFDANGNPYDCGGDNTVVGVTPVSSIAPTDLSTLNSLPYSASGSASAPYTTPATVVNAVSNSPASVPPPAPSLSTFFSNLAADAAGVAKVAETPVTTVQLPNGTTITGPNALSGQTLSMASMSSVLPIVLLGLGALLLLGMVKK